MQLLIDTHCFYIQDCKGGSVISQQSKLSCSIPVAHWPYHFLALETIEKLHLAQSDINSGNLFRFHHNKIRIISSLILPVWIAITPFPTFWNWENPFCYWQRAISSYKISLLLLFEIAECSLFCSDYIKFVLYVCAPFTATPQQMQLLKKDYRARK